MLFCVIKPPRQSAYRHWKYRRCQPDHPTRFYSKTLFFNTLGIVAYHLSLLCYPSLAHWIFLILIRIAHGNLSYTMQLTVIFDFSLSVRANGNRDAEKNRNFTLCCTFLRHPTLLAITSPTSLDLLDVRVMRQFLVSNV